MAYPLTLLMLVALPFVAALAIALLHNAARAVHSGIAAGASALGLVLLALAGRASAGRRRAFRLVELGARARP